jgi:hypothetical protein
MSVSLTEALRLDDPVLLEPFCSQQFPEQILVYCMDLQALRCMKWWLSKQPQLINQGKWEHTHYGEHVKPLCHALAHLWRTPKFREIVQILFDHGAQAWNPDNEYEPFRSFWGLPYLFVAYPEMRRIQRDRNCVAMMFMARGAAFDAQNQFLVSLWCKLACMRSRMALMRCLYVRGMPKDVCIMVAQSKLLSAPDLWEHWHGTKK